MAYLLVLASGHGDDKPGHPGRGDVIGVYPDDWVFGEHEKDESLFRVIRIDESVEEFLEFLDSDSNMSSDAVTHPFRKLKIDLDRLDAIPGARKVRDAKKKFDVVDLPKARRRNLKGLGVARSPKLRDEVIT